MIFGHPIKRSHSSSRQEHFPPQFSPKAPGGHVELQSLPKYPGLHPLNTEKNQMRYSCRYCQKINLEFD